MNIFTTNDCPIISAQEMCDKHVVKMIVEYAQLMSTAHRVLDGKNTTIEQKPVDVLNVGYTRMNI